MSPGASQSSPTESIMKKSTEILLFAALIGAAFVIPNLRAEEPAAPATPPADHAGRDSGRRGPGARWDRAAKELGLTADQEAKWKEIGQREKAAVEPIFNDSSLSRDEKRAKMREANKPFADQRRAVLTPEQQTKFDELRTRMRERGERDERGPRKPKE